MRRQRKPASRYTYQPLQSGCIRISTIFACSDNSKLRIRLHTHELNSLPFYNALSYCWGKGPIDKACFCDDGASAGVLRISNNLLQALMRIRKINKDISIWIDQICIDQQNNKEKAHQVQLMGQVYSKASQVVVWLGPADGGTALAFGLLESVAKQVEHHIKTGPDISDDRNNKYYPLDLSSADSSEWLAFRAIFDRPWFSWLCFFKRLHCLRR